MDVQVLFFVLVISQVSGNPTYYWSPQPDCQHSAGYQQNTNEAANYQPNADQINYQQVEYQQETYQQNTYPEEYQQPKQRVDYQDQSGYSYESPTSSQTNDNYQTSSYQEMLQSMIEETIRALSEIVQATVRASKQEISSLAKMFIDSIPKKFCNPGEETQYDTNDEYEAGVEQNEEIQSTHSPTGSIQVQKGSSAGHESSLLSSSTTANSSPSSHPTGQLFTESSTSIIPSVVKTSDIGNISSITSQSSHSSNPTSTAILSSPTMSSLNASLLSLNSTKPMDQPFLMSHPNKFVNVTENAMLSNRFQYSNISTDNESSTKNNVSSPTTIENESSNVTPSVSEGYQNESGLPMKVDSVVSTKEGSTKNSSLLDLNRATTESTQTDSTTEEYSNSTETTLPTRQNVSNVKTINLSNVQNMSAVVSTESDAQTTTTISTPENGTTNIPLSANAGAEALINEPTIDDYDQQENAADSDQGEFSRKPKL